MVEERMKMIIPELLGIMMVNSGKKINYLYLMNF